MEDEESRREEEAPERPGGSDSAQAVLHNGVWEWVALVDGLPVKGSWSSKKHAEVEAARVRANGNSDSFCERAEEIPKDEPDEGRESEPDEWSEDEIAVYVADRPDGSRVYLAVTAKNHLVDTTFSEPGAAKKAAQRWLDGKRKLPDTDAPGANI